MPRRLSGAPAGVKHQTRDAIEEIWGPRAGYKHEWPTRVDEMLLDEPDKWVQSACLLCSNGCGMDIGVKEGKVVGVRGRATDRVNKGRLGPKGMYGWTSIHSKDRLTHPQIRKNGKLERATWDEAMDLIVQKAKATREKLTSHGIGFYTSGQLFLEEYYALAVIGKAGLCTLHMDGNTRLCTATAAAAMRESFGSDGQPGSYRDIDFTDCILMVGHNMAATQTVLWSRILDRLAGPDPPKLIVIDPRLSNSAREATVHLAPKIGTNLALLNGIQHVLFRDGFVNEEWCDKHVVGLEKLRETVRLCTPTRTEQITGVPALQVEQAAKIIGHTKSLLSTCLQGVYQSNQATASACAVNNINLLRGLIGREGSGIFQMNGQPTAQNNRESGCDGEFPGFRNYDNKNQMKDLARIWNIDYKTLPHWNQPTHVENMLSYIQGDSLEFFWISGTNPLVSLPNLPRVRDLLTKPNVFVIAQDIFPTETTAIADVVLPAAQWGEKTGCFTNVDRTVHISHKAVEPPGEARPDFDIFVDFSNRMDFRDKDSNPLIPWTTPEDGFEAFKRLTKGRPCDYTGMSYEKLTGGSGLQWPCTEERYPNGCERLFEDGVFFTDTEYCESFGHDLETGAPVSKDEYMAINPNGRAVLKSCHYIPPTEVTNDEYPLSLSTGRSTFQFHTRSKTGRAQPLQDAQPEPTVTISTEDAEELDIKEGEEVVVTSRRGVVQMKAYVGGIAKGQTFIPMHYGYFDQPDDSVARAANELTQDSWDPVSKQPYFKGGAIRISKASTSTSSNPQQQASRAAAAATAKPDADAIHDDWARGQHMTLWFGTTLESLALFSDACDTSLPSLVHDAEIIGGVRVLKTIADAALTDLEPFARKYAAQRQYGKRLAKALGEAVFPWRDESKTASAYGALATLQGLLVFLASTQGHLSGLAPASQALWDAEFTDAVNKAQESVGRCQKWVKQQIGVRAPQTLVVPSRKRWTDDEELEEGNQANPYHQE